MNLIPISYNGLTLNDANFKAVFPADSAINQLPVDLHYSPRADADPLFAVKMRREKQITLMVQLLGETPHAQVDALNQAFDLRLNAEAELLARDADDSDREWYLMATPASQPKIVGALYTVTLRAGLGLWRSKSLHTDGWSLTASGQTHDIAPSPVGNSPALPSLRFTPTAATGSNWPYRRLALITNPTDTAIADALDLTAGDFDTAALISGGKMQPDGDDLRVIVDGVERDRWLDGINTASTKVWANLALSPRIELALSGAIAGSGTVTTLPFKKTGGWRAAIRRLPSRGALVIGGEVFSWTSKDETGPSVGGVTRAILDTSMAAHADGDACKWLEHVVWLVYGDSTLGAPVVDDTQKPMFDLTSTNASHVYTSMADTGGRRTGAWAASVLRQRGPDSTTYIGNHEAEADPAAEMGMSIQSWLSGSRYQDDNAEITWQLYIPQGVTTVSMTGEKYRSSSSWPSTAALEASKDGRRWLRIWNESSPSAVSTWESVTHSGVSLGATYPFVRFRLKGGVGAGSGYRASFEVNDVTLTLDSAGVPSVTLGAEVGAVDLDLAVTHMGSGENFSLRCQVSLGETLEVDCANRAVTNLSNNVRGPLVERPDGQLEWLRLLPGETNTLKVKVTGLSGMDVEARYEDRNL